MAALTIFSGLSVHATPPQSFATRQAGAQPAAPGMLAPGRSDDHPGPLAARQRELTARALEARLQGKTKGRTHQVARGQYVELARDGEDTVWTVLAEFGDSIDPVIGGSPGPRRNQIPQPDRQVDNNTPWAPDFSKAYYEQLLFADAPGATSMRTYYREQSSNRYTVNGEVADWVRLSFNEAYYGTKQCGSTCFERPWMFVRDSINAWYAARIAAGSTPEQIDTYLSRFDRWDRYDHDGDGNFSEPDGYIDHFQTIHAGEAYEQGGGAQGKDAIWSHKGYAYATGIGVIGPPLNPLGGSRIGGSRYWVADYIVVGENSPVGVIVHEFGHDLGLPDLYDRAGNFGGTNNSTGAWTLMSGGEWTSSGLADDGIGSMPVHMGAWEKITLGWSNFEVVTAGQYRALKLGPAETSTRQRQQLVVLLPDKVLTSDTGPPYAGSFFYFSGIGDLIDSSMTRSLTIPAGAVMLHAKVRYDIELDWDYAYLTVNGVPIATNLSTGVNPNGQNFGHGITGSSGGKWIDLTADFSAFAGQSVTIGFRYWTDQLVNGAGFGVDDIAITGLSIDGAEADAGWTFSGFSRSTGVARHHFFNAYLAEYRQYRGSDEGLRSGAYVFQPDRPSWVHHYPYEDGLLVWYFDTSFKDNDVTAHCLSGRCGGLVLPVDAHPALLVRPDGHIWDPTVLSHDSTFGLKPTAEFCLPFFGIEQCFGSLPGNPLFDDTEAYWVQPDPAIGHSGLASVPLPGFGVTIRVAGLSSQGDFMQVVVAPK
jgi:immune inhibitor A